MSLAELSDFDLVSPSDLGEALDILAREAEAGRPASPVAGCTDWMVERHMAPGREGTAPPGLVVDVTRIPALRGIEERDGVLRVGAAEPLLGLRRSALVAERCALLARMASDVGSRQIQARATLGGNLASGSPAADGVAALFALGADVVLASRHAKRRVPVRAFYTGYRTNVRRPDELIVRVEIVLPSRAAHQAWRKVGTRNAQAISKVALAAVAETGPGGALSRIGFGVASVAEVVVGLDTVCALAAGKAPDRLDAHQLEAAVDRDIRPIDDIRSTARYRRHVVQALVRRFFEAMR
jgi:CO/xanthine dehydrogenase FAD-binding subunit